MSRATKTSRRHLCITASPGSRGSTNCAGWTTIRREMQADEMRNGGGKTYE
jgi:hypothetical protein